MNRTNTAEYTLLTAQIEKVLGEMIHSPSEASQVKAERERAKLLLKLAQELREICD